jgi:threonyl-tRNA synthetase
MNNDDQIELKEWDHKRLGRELDLFTFSDTVGKGLPLWTPKGASIRREIERFIVDEEIKFGYSHVYTPDIAKLDLYKKSGHYPYYKDSMYAPIEIEDEEFMLRPMTCPHHFELYLDRPRSYRELPVRFAELAKLYRFEKSGELMGLQRVRSFCLSDAHIICSKEQAAGEVEKALDLIDHVSKVLGLKKDKDYSFRLSLGDRSDDKKYFKDDASWDHAEEMLRQVLEKRKSKFVEAEGEAAFYGPKIDIQMLNANGKEDTAFTVQFDFVMPKRFGLNFINEKGQEEEAVVVHRSSVGAIERVIAFLIEKYRGNFPTWLTPVQVKILPITDRNIDFAQKIKAEMILEGIRVEVDEKAETLGAKIRNAQKEKVAYMLILGDKEEKEGKVSVRKRNGDDLGVLPLEDFKKLLRKDISEKTVELD